ncbi:Polyubiquitin [Taenia solium]|eukprot:TsM_000686900 transcript=TsM_000686900 gene=TsM_000686900
MMHIEVEHLDSTILSLKADKEFTVENLKHIVSQNIHIPASDLTLASNGSLLEDGHRFSEYFAGDTCKVLLFLRKGEQIRNNVEVDLGDGKVLFVPACMNWTVGELKQKLQKAIEGEPLDETKFFTFARYIMEDDRRLEEYKLKEGSKITVFTYLNVDSTNTMNREASLVKNGEETSHPIVSCSQFSQYPSSSKNFGELERLLKYKVFENPVDDIIKSSLPCTTPLPPTPSPPLLLKPSEVESIENPNNNINLTTDSSIPLQMTEQSSLWNAAANPTDHQSQNSSQNIRNDSESLGPWPVSVESKTIVIPGKFQQRQAKPVFNRQIHSGTGIDRGKSADKMNVIFTDGTRKMTVELPITATVVEGLEAVKTRISDSDKDRLRLFKGYVQMEAHHPLSQYGIVNGSTVVFKKPGPVQKF